MKQPAQHASSGRLTTLASLLAGLFFSASAWAGSNVVISQVYGGGGNSGANWKSDFVELFNSGDQDANLAGWSVQYASSSGSTWTVTPLSGTLAAGHYYLIQESTGTGGKVELPAPDVANGPAAMSATAGKVVLVKTATKLVGAAPVSADIVDIIGYGGANFSEGTALDALSNTTGALRNGDGCTDTNDNKSDFTIATPTPRNSASAPHSCSATAPALTLTCPASLSSLAGSGTSAVLKAAGTSPVTSAIIGSGAVAGIALDGFVGGVDASVKLDVAANVPAGNYPVVVSFANGANESASCTVNVAVTAATADLAIPQIQGSGHTSPYAGTVQSTSGVVTKKVSSGFFIQDPAGDGDPTTSDGIFVFNNTFSVNVGDLVRVTGAISEYTPSGAPRSVTEIANVSGVIVKSTGNTITPTNIALPNDDLGRYEGMLVNVTTPLTVNGNDYLGERGELVLASGSREAPTNAYRPGTQEAKDLAAANDKNMLVLDDGIFTTPALVPYLADDGTVRSGDTVTNLVGVLDFGAIGGGGGWYKLQPTSAPQFSRTNPRVDAPQVASGNVKVASANVLNFFTTFTDGQDVFGNQNQGCALGTSVSKSNCRGADSLVEFTRQRDKIVDELKALDADVVGLMEIQNNGETAVSYLVDQLNLAIGSTTYAVVPKPAATGTDAIRVAMIYKPAKLALVGGALSDADAINNRPPMAQTFKLKENGAKFSVIVNHLKSKSGCGGAGQGDTDSGDGQGCWNATRAQQATRLLQAFVPQVVAAAGDPDVLAVGDFNSYGHEDPIAVLTANGFVNELERFVRGHGETPYSYVFDGQRGYLDHALASTAMDAQVAGVVEWHNNADEPAAIDYNLGDNTVDPYVANAFRASDHDPVLVSLNLAPAFTDVTASVKVAQSGLTFNRFTAQYTGTVTFTNTSGQALNGPLQFLLQGLPAGVTLVNKSGEQGGAPYITLPNATLAPDASVSVTTTFNNPGKVVIGYTPVLYSGTF